MTNRRSFIRALVLGLLAAPASTDERLAESLMVTHNRDRAILRPRGIDLKTFQPIERTSELPVTTSASTSVTISTSASGT